MKTRTSATDPMRKKTPGGKEKNILGREPIVFLRHRIVMYFGRRLNNETKL